MDRRMAQRDPFAPATAHFSTPSLRPVFAWRRGKVGVRESRGRWPALTTGGGTDIMGYWVYLRIRQPSYRGGATPRERLREEGLNTRVRLPVRQSRQRVSPSLSARRSG